MRGREGSSIEEGVRVRGTVRAGETLSVRGRIDGTIIAEEDVHVEEGGVVAADVTASSVTVSGVVVGRIVARSQVTVSSTGQVKGDVISPSFTTEAGARIEGAVEVGDVARIPERPRRPVLAPVEARDATEAPSEEASDDERRPVVVVKKRT